jgi:2-dehydropantoate 2-reductase
MRIAIIGAGGVGGYLGAKLGNAGHDVTLVARGDHFRALQQNGLELESSDGNLHTYPAVTETLSQSRPFDLFIVAVKSFDTEPAGRIIRPELGPSSIVLTIQNGVENEDILSDMLGSGFVIGGIAWIFSTIRAPGIIQHAGGTGKFNIGEMDGPVGHRIRSLENIFQSAQIRAVATDNIRRMIWEKWIFISAVGGMTTFAKSTIGAILGDEMLRDSLEAIVREASLVAEAKTGGDFSGVFDKTMTHIRRLPAAGTSSMYYDVMHGKRLEVEALNGAAVRFGNECGIPVPVNKRIYRALTGGG